MRERQEVGGYQLIKRIGTGGMSSVFEAEGASGERVALKLLHPAVAAEPSSRARLRREVAMLQRVHGPYVASIIDAETEDADVFIVTELVDGPTLERDVHDAGAYTDSDLVELGEELGSALRSIHNEDVLHRDLKPSNVMMGPDGPVLIDFGIAQLGDDLRLTEQGALAHTPGWADPRIIRGEDPDEAADWWSLSAVLAFAATGRPPFGSGNPQAVMNRVLEGRADLDGIPVSIAAALRSALDPQLNERISYEELVQAFREPDSFIPDVIDDEDGEPAEYDDEDDAGNATQRTEMFNSEGFAALPPTGYQWDEDDEDNDGVDSDHSPWQPEPEPDGLTRTSVYTTPPTELDRTPGPVTPPRSYPPSSAGHHSGLPPMENRTRAMPLPSSSAPNYQPVNSRPLQPAPGYPQPQQPQMPMDYGRMRGDVDSATPRWIFLPGTHRMFFFLLWIALAIFGSAIPFWVLLSVALALFVLDAVGVSLDDTMSRRIRRGGRQTGEVGRILLKLPVVLVLGLIKIAISTAVGAIVGAGVSWVVYNLAVTPARPAVGGGVAVALLIMWLLGTSGKARLGANALMEVVTPSRGYRIFWIAVVVAVIFGALIFATSGTWVNWNPVGISL